MATKLVHGNFGKEHAVHLRVVKVQSYSQTLHVGDAPSKKGEKTKEKEKIVGPKAEGEWRITWNTNAKLTPSQKSKKPFMSTGHPGWTRVRDVTICPGNEADLFTEKRYSRFNKPECCVSLLPATEKAKKTGLNLVFESKAVRDRWIESLNSVKALTSDESALPNALSPRGSTMGMAESSLTKPLEAETSVFENVDSSDEDMMLVQAEALEVSALGVVTERSKSNSGDPGFLSPGVLLSLAILDEPSEGAN